MEDHGDTEAHEAGLEADDIAVLLNDKVLVFVLFVREIELGNRSKDPKHLTVKLLLQVGIENRVQLHLVADRREGEDISQVGAVILDALLWLLHEYLQAFVDDLGSARLQLNQKSE